MERLTIKDEDGDLALNCNECSNDGSLNCDIENCYMTAICRLAAIEDILGPTYDLSRLRELVEADREGRFLPVTVGQTVYILSPEGIDEEKIAGIISDGKTLMVEISHFLGVYEYSEKNFGKWVFLSREAAEKALEAINGKE